MDLSNYGIKRMLPKLIIAAILVNISFWICAIAVDISNILGSSLKSFFDGLAVSGGGGGGFGITDIGVGGVVTVLLAAGLVAGAIAVALAISVPVVLAVVLAIATIILILLAREALIILLIVVSPVAFVFYLLPNTEQWYKKWLKLFSSLLMLYPVVAVVFGASGFAGRLINNTANGDPMLQLTAIAVATLPLFLVPSVLKNSLNATGTLGAKMSGLSGKATGRIGKKVSSNSQLGQRYKEYQAAAETRRVGGLASGRKGGRMAQRFDRSRLGKYVGGDRGAAFATEAEHKIFNEEVGRQKSTLSGMKNEDLLKILEDGTGSTEYQAAAAGIVMSRDHRESHLKALDIAGRRGKDSKDGAIGDIQKQMSADMKDKPFALGDRAAGALQTGNYGKNPADSTDGDISGSLKERVGTKLSAANLASMNPDEMNAIHALATSGSLSSDELKNLKAQITLARGNEQLKGLIKPQATSQHDDILSL